MQGNVQTLPAFPQIPARKLPVPTDKTINYPLQPEISSFEKYILRLEIYFSRLKT
jgi:hypothetical protein